MCGFEMEGNRARSATRCHRQSQKTVCDLPNGGSTSAEDPFPRRGPRRNRPAKTGQRLERTSFSVGDAFGAGSGTFSRRRSWDRCQLGLAIHGLQVQRAWGSGKELQAAVGEHLPHSCQGGRRSVWRGYREGCRRKNSATVTRCHPHCSNVLQNFVEKNVLEAFIERLCADRE